MDRATGTTAEQVLVVLDALGAAGCWVALEGGWGVDALVGRQSRPHRDVDLDVDAAQETEVLEVLGRLGYAVETDWRPNRVELVAPDGSRVDVHPLTSIPDGSRYQAGLSGERFVYPAGCFVEGRLLARPVRCLSAAQQVAWHQGYELRDTDVADLALLRDLL